MTNRVKHLSKRITMTCLGRPFNLRIEADNEFVMGRIFIQINYESDCSKTGESSNWRSRKYYLSKHMTDDEIVKTIYLAFETCIKHEIMEGFKIDDKALFNPHINFEELLKISEREVRRKP